jgi:hypothetical protein
MTKKQEETLKKVVAKTHKLSDMWNVATEAKSTIKENLEKDKKEQLQKQQQSVVDKKQTSAASEASTSKSNASAAKNPFTIAKKAADAKILKRKAEDDEDSIKPESNKYFKIQSKQNNNDDIVAPIQPSISIFQIDKNEITTEKRLEESKKRKSQLSPFSSPRTSPPSSPILESQKKKQKTIKLSKPNSTTATTVESKLEFSDSESSLSNNDDDNDDDDNNDIKNSIQIFENKNKRKFSSLSQNNSHDDSSSSNSSNDDNNSKNDSERSKIHSETIKSVLDLEKEIKKRKLQEISQKRNAELKAEQAKEDEKLRQKELKKAKEGPKYQGATCIDPVRGLHILEKQKMLEEYQKTDCINLKRVKIRDKETGEEKYVVFDQFMQCDDAYIARFVLCCDFASLYPSVCIAMNTAQDKKLVTRKLIAMGFPVQFCNVSTEKWPDKKIPEGLPKNNWV